MTEAIKDLSVLVVEDSFSVLSHMKRMLSYLDVTKVFTAKDGEEALEILGGEGNAVDLVLCDWNILEPDTIDLLRRARKVSPKLSFLMVSDAIELESVTTASEAGDFTYIVKPYSMNELRIKLDRALIIQRTQEEIA